MLHLYHLAKLKNCHFPDLTAKSFPELGCEFLDHTVRLHVEHMIIEWLARHRLQRFHVGPVHSDGVDLNPSSPCQSRHLLYFILWSPVRYDDGHFRDVFIRRPGTGLLGECAFHRRFDGQAGHGASGERLNPREGAFEVRFVGVRLQEELNVDRAGIVDQSNTCGIDTNIQRVHHVREEHFDLLEFGRTDAPRAVDDEHQVQRAALAHLRRS